MSLRPYISSCSDRPEPLPVFGVCSGQFAPRVMSTPRPRLCASVSAPCNADRWASLAHTDGVKPISTPPNPASAIALSSSLIAAGSTEPGRTKLPHHQRNFGRTWRGGSRNAPGSSSTDAAPALGAPASSATVASTTTPTVPFNPPTCYKISTLIQLAPTMNRTATSPTLPRGRHGLAPEAVRASQRERLIEAMLDRVAADGYPATTVTKVVAAARVSPNTFYELFEDKADSFLAACREGARELLEHLYAARGETWTERVRDGMRTYLRWWSDRPAISWAYLVELPAAGARATAERDAVYEGYRALFAVLASLAREEDPALAPLSPLAVRVLVAGLTEVVADEVRAGRVDRLPELEDDLVHFVVTTLADAATARIA